MKNLKDITTLASKNELATYLVFDTKEPQIKEILRANLFFGNETSIVIASDKSVYRVFAEDGSFFNLYNESKITFIDKLVEELINEKVNA